MSESVWIRGPLRGDGHESRMVLGGVLDNSSYLAVRNAVIKAALDEPQVVIVDVSELSAPAASAWSVFTSARWQVSTWPDVPIMLVCTDEAGRESIRAGGITRRRGRPRQKCAATDQCDKGGR